MEMVEEKLDLSAKWEGIGKFDNRLFTLHRVKSRK